MRTTPRHCLPAVVALTLIWGGALHGQTMWERVASSSGPSETVGENGAADSPLWWTLSDALSPETLADRLTDPTENQTRFAVAQLEHGPIEEVSTVTTYLDGAQNPELVPTWLAWSALAHRFADFEGAEERERLGLLSHGVSPAAIEVAIASAHRVNTQESALRGEIQPAFDALVELLREAEASIGSTGAQTAAESGDAATLADATGRRLSRVQEILTDGTRSSVAEASVEELTFLADALGAEDWRLLRGYLRSEVAPGIRVMSLLPTDEPAGGE